jgi:HSP20 family protein
MHEELEVMLNELWNGPRFSGARPAFRPLIDIVRTERPAELRVAADLAGVDPSTIRVVVHARALLIAGRRLPMHPKGRLRYHQLEIQYGPFERRLALPENVDPDGARASYDRGMLTIRLPIAATPTRNERVSIEIRTRR